MNTKPNPGQSTPRRVGARLPQRQPASRTQPNGPPNEPTLTEVRRYQAQGAELTGRLASVMLHDLADALRARGHQDSDPQMLDRANVTETLACAVGEFGIAANARAIVALIGRDGDLPMISTKASWEFSMLAEAAAPGDDVNRTMEKVDAAWHRPWLPQAHIQGGMSLDDFSTSEHDALAQLALKQELAIPWRSIRELAFAASALLAEEERLGQTVAPLPCDAVSGVAMAAVGKVSIPPRAFLRNLASVDRTAAPPPGTWRAEEPD